MKNVRGLALLAAWLLLPVGTAAQDRVGSEADLRRTVHAGLGSSRAWNFVGISHEFHRDGPVSAYWAAGFGTILLGAGVAYHSDREGHGVLLSGTAGVAGAHASASVRLRLQDRMYAVAGVSAGTFFLQHHGLLPLLAIEYRY